MSENALEKIEKVLDEKIRPILREHGGNVQIQSFVDGTLRVKSLGGCAHCPSGMFEIEHLITDGVRTTIPEVRSVIVVTGVSDGLLETARALMSKTKEKAG
jgi:Fe-S cluster biogenesis protein NfuA